MMMWLARGVLLGMLALGWSAGPASAQFGYFGQNKIQYRAFEWRVLRGEHVDLYFYPDEEELARVALAYAEESYRDLEIKFTHAVTRRIPLIIYASHQDFEQTNILPFTPPEGLLGVTEFIKRRVALPFNGSYHEFRHTLRHELVHVFQLSLSAEVAHRYPRLRRVPLPLWFAEGLAEYWSAGEDTRDEMVLRDLTIEGRLPALARLANVYGGIVYPLGGVIHRYLGETYGDWRVAQLYRDLWKYGSFEEAVRGVYGRSLEELTAEWRHWMRRRYYPAVQQRRPLRLVGQRVATYAVRPLAYRAPGDTLTQVLYLSPRSGYTDIYVGTLRGGPARPVVKGERTAEFESFHPFESRMDVSPTGVLVFGSKYLDRDALFLWDLAQGKVVGRYQFPQLVSVLSPAWAPDGRSVVFSGLTFAGYSDLYRLWLADGRLERLTSDRYLDADPTISPDGRTVAFVSDRTAFGAAGARNLFTLDLATGRVDYLTYGPWSDESPRWSRAGGRIYFSSDRSGSFEVYSIDSIGAGRRESDALGGAFDPQWVPEDHGFLVAGFDDLAFSVYFAPAARLAPDSGGEPVTLAPERMPPQWEWQELTDPRYARADASPYERRFSLDFAAADAVVAPGIGSAQGAVFLLSDLLSDHLLFIGVSSLQGNGLGNLLENFNGSVVYVNQARRLNWGLGAFRLRGFFYEGDYFTVYQEESYGATGLLRYPISRFRRLEGQYTVEHSDRTDFVPTGSGDFPRRVGWLASNYVSYVKDNTLWLETGPIDGERFNLTGGIVNDLSHGRFDSYVASVDYRRYFRLSLRSAYAVRLFGYYADGERPRRANIGGSLGLRGYPLFGYITGTRAYLVNQELRFPLTNFLSVGFPFGELRFPGVQGALFVDVGRAWTPLSTERAALATAGLGLRMAVAPPFVLRLDLGYRLNRDAQAGYFLRSKDRTPRFVHLFFGFNY